MKKNKKGRKRKNKKLGGVKIHMPPRGLFSLMLATRISHVSPLPRACARVRMRAASSCNRWRGRRARDDDNGESESEGGKLMNSCDDDDGKLSWRRWQQRRRGQCAWTRQWRGQQAFMRWWRGLRARDDDDGEGEGEARSTTKTRRSCHAWEHSHVRM